ncbi:MAG: hypothetical protein ABS41_00555 [Arenimonas sp. SCN 70-307]|uniref:hypothetical protein n=1 Tax=Arenimonas sp. SCN 70-307 TaxID=1660089 RepID=UPI00086973D8|nr:hypothetical protein [Arenimonas sp. SCN 70-307]ODS64931.1 MAG: hypothetical protein ABS41_00555 [Arenimonas sp. SCN 70-307]
MKWILSIVLVVSLSANVWLSFHLLDAGVTQAYMGDSIQRNRTALLQCIAVTNDHLKTGARRDALIARAQAVAGDYPLFSNDDHWWIGPFGMRWDEDGKLVSVAEWETVYQQIKKEGLVMPPGANGDGG